MGGDGLAPLGVGAAEDARLGHGRVGEQGGLDLARHHVLAAGDDRVDLAAQHAQAPALVELAEVARVQGRSATVGPSTTISPSGGDLDRDARERLAGGLGVPDLRHGDRGARLGEPVGRRDRPARVAGARQQRGSAGAPPSITTRNDGGGSRSSSRPSWVGTSEAMVTSVRSAGPSTAVVP